MDVLYCSAEGCVYVNGFNMVWWMITMSSTFYF